MFISESCIKWSIFSETGPPTLLWIRDPGGKQNFGRPNPPSVLCSSYLSSVDVCNDLMGLLVLHCPCSSNPTIIIDNIFFKMSIPYSTMYWVAKKLARSKQKTEQHVNRKRHTIEKPKCVVICCKHFLLKKGLQWSNQIWINCHTGRSSKNFNKTNSRSIL